MRGAREKAALLAPPPPIHYLLGLRTRARGVSVRRLRCAAALLFLSVFPSFRLAAQVDPRLYQSLKWRNIGPFRGGRTKAATGVPGQPNVFYIGAVNGGVWKSTDFGRSWKPIFDDQPTGSIGAIAVGPPDPNILYVGGGGGLHAPDLDRKKVV